MQEQLHFTQRLSVHHLDQNNRRGGAMDVSSNSRGFGTGKPCGPNRTSAVILHQQVDDNGLNILVNGINFVMLAF